MVNSLNRNGWKLVEKETETKVQVEFYPNFRKGCNLPVMKCKFQFALVHRNQKHRSLNYTNDGQLSRLFNIICYELIFIYGCIQFGQDLLKEPVMGTNLLWLKDLLIRRDGTTVQKRQILSLRSGNWKGKMLLMGFLMRVERMILHLRTFWTYCLTSNEEWIHDGLFLIQDSRLCSTEISFSILGPHSFLPFLRSKQPVNEQLHKRIPLMKGCIVG